MFGSGEDGYGGLLGAFPYAFRTSDSRLFRGYVVVGGLVAVVATVLFASSLVTLLADTFRTSGGTFTFSRSFVVVVALGIVAPILAPVLLVARRHRRTASTVRYDRALATAGFCFLLSIYLALVISAPPAVRDEPPALLAPLVRVLYDLPQIAGLAPLLVGAALIYLAHRAYR
jgi:hypothetical protein